MPYRTAFVLTLIALLVSEAMTLSLLVIDHTQMSQTIDECNRRRDSLCAQRDSLQASYSRLLERIGPMPHRPTGAVGNVGAAPSR